MLNRTSAAATWYPFVCASALLVANLAWAQAGFEGLDLTDDAKKAEPAKGSTSKKPKEPDPGVGLDLTSDSNATTPAPKPAKKPGAGDDTRPVAKKADEGPPIERDVTQEDRVKSVQRKLYVKRGRFELAPSFVINVNDPYYTKLGGAVRAAFHLADNFAVAARFMLIQVVPTDDVRVAKKNLQAKIFYSVPYWSAMADAEWSPFYGKVSFLNSILHLDAYLLAGGGVVYTETSSVADASRGGVKPAFDLGVGMRFVAKDFLAVNVGLVNTTYIDVPIGTNKAVTQNLMMLQVGLSIFLPFKSTFREAE